jgi:hypothetical protein
MRPVWRDGVSLWIFLRLSPPECKTRHSANGAAERPQHGRHNSYHRSKRLIGRIRIREKKSRNRGTPTDKNTKHKNENGAATTPEVDARQPRKKPRRRQAPQHEATVRLLRDARLSAAGNAALIIASVRQLWTSRGKIFDSNLEGRGMVAPFPQAGAFAPDVMNSGDQIRKYQRSNDF